MANNYGKSYNHHSKNLEMKKFIWIFPLNPLNFPVWKERLSKSWHRIAIMYNFRLRLQMCLKCRGSVVISKMHFENSMDFLLLIASI